MPRVSLRLDPEAKQRPRLLRFLRKRDVLDLRVGSITLPLGELSLDGLEAVAMAEIKSFRREGRHRTACRLMVTA